MAKKETEEKNVEIKLESFKVGDPINQEIKYKQLILSAVNGQMPKDGITFGEMKSRLKLIDKIESVSDGETLSLTQDEFKTVSKLILDTRWTLMDKGLLKFIEIFETSE